MNALVSLQGRLVEKFGKTQRSAALFTVVTGCCEMRNETEEQFGVSDVLKLPKPEGTDVRWRDGMKELM